MKRKSQSNVGEVALKIDIIKAYDRIKWGYLRAIMLKMGFATQWVNWMMLCVTTVSYKISVNGELVGPLPLLV